jgi:urocanate hydratase
MQQSKCFLSGPIPGYITESTLKMNDFDLDIEATTSEHPEDLVVFGSICKANEIINRFFKVIVIYFKVEK